MNVVAFFGCKVQAKNERYFFSYFQFFDFPSESISTASLIRFSLVSSLLASTILPMYSFLWLLLKASKVAVAALFFFRRAAKSSGIVVFLAGPAFGFAI